MYLSFYRFKHKPFQISTDPKFLWLGEKHKEALATLRYGVLDNKGFLLLTGDVGTGKTTLINALLKTLDKNTYVASIRDPALEPMDFFHYTAYAFGINPENIKSKAAFLIQFEKFLVNAYRDKRKVLLIIDESQRMSQEVLEEVRSLSNIEREESKLINIFFVGQIEFNDILLRHENRALRQRITTHYNIEILSEEETSHYIQYRLDVASDNTDPHFFAPVQRIEKGESVHQPFKLQLPQEKLNIFPKETIREIFAFSKGYPRLINIICDRALLTGYVDGFRTITPRQIQDCAKELEIVDRKSLSAAAVKEPSTGVQLEKQAGGESYKNVVDAGSDFVANVSQKESSDDVVKQQGADSSTNHRAQLVLETENAGSAEKEKWKSVYPMTNQANRLNRAWEKDEYDISLLSSRAMVAELKRHVNAAEGIGTGVAVKDTDGGIPADLEEMGESGQNRSSKSKKILFAGFLILILAGGYGYLNPEGSFVKLEFVNQFIDDARRWFDRQPSISPLEREDSVETAIPGQNSASLDRAADLPPAVASNKVIIQFPADSSLPNERSLQALDNLVGVASGNPSSAITVSYFSPDLNNATIADIFSESRANTVKSYLMGKGVSGSRIFVRKKGTTEMGEVSGDGERLTPAESVLEVEVAL